MIKTRRQRGRLLLLHVQLGGLLIAHAVQRERGKPIVAVMTRAVSASGMDWGVLAAAGVLTTSCRGRS